MSTNVTSLTFFPHSILSLILIIFTNSQNGSIYPDKHDHVRCLLLNSGRCRRIVLTLFGGD